MENEVTNNEMLYGTSGLELKFQELGTLLHNIKNDFDKYRNHFLNTNNQKILERIISIEKDFETIKTSFDELKEEVKIYKKSADDLIDQYKELVGSVNQLKLSVDEINQRYTFEKEQKLNVFWQLLVPIVLSLMFFVFGIIFRSCSSAHQSNVKGGNNNKSEYIIFESNK